MDNVDWVGLFQQKLDAEEIPYVDSLVVPEPPKPVLGFQRKLWNRKVKGQLEMWGDEDDGTHRTEYDH